MYDQRLIDDVVKKLGWKRLQENTAVDGDILKDKRIGEVLDPEVDYTYYKEKFYVNFIVFIDHKITFYRVGALHALNEIGTLSTGRTCDFS